MIWNLLTDATKDAGNNWAVYVIGGVLIVGFIGLFIWQNISNKKKQKEAQSMIDNIAIGDKIKTIGGVCGILVEVNNDENTFTIETGTADRKSYVKFDRGAIYQVGKQNQSAPVKPAEEKKEEPAKEPKAE